METASVSSKQDDELVIVLNIEEGEIPVYSLENPF